MPNLVLLMGPPGSGKSSYAKTMEDQGYTRISQDDQGADHVDFFRGCISTGRDIVVDRMNFNQEQRNRYRNYAIASDLGYKISVVEFVVPRKVCFERCMMRQNHPTIKDELNANNALNTYFKFYEPADENEYSEVVRIHYSSPEKKTAIMCDLDGTLCNLNHRLHFVKGEGKKNWGEFFRRCGEDSIYEDVAGIINLESKNGTEIVFCSGRPEEYRTQTQMWLDSNIGIEAPLVMRPKGNYKSDNITKVMLYEYEIKPYFNVKYVLDDRDQVVLAWRKIGLNCLQVRPGDF